MLLSGTVAINYQAILMNAAQRDCGQNPQMTEPLQINVSQLDYGHQLQELNQYLYMLLSEIVAIYNGD